MDLESELYPLIAISSLRGRDQPGGTDGSILEAICQNSLACSSWEALLVCELAGHGLGANADPEEKEFRWPQSAALCPPGMSSWLHPQRQRSSLWLLQVLIGQESRMGHTCLSMGPALCPVVASVITLWKTAWAFPHSPQGRPCHNARSIQVLEESFQCPQDNHTDLAGGPRPCHLTRRASPSLRACLPTTRRAWPAAAF